MYLSLGKQYLQTHTIRTLFCLCILSVFIYPHILKYFLQLLVDEENHSSVARFQGSVIISRVNLGYETLEQGSLGFLFLEKWKSSFPLLKVTTLSVKKKMTPWSASVKSRLTLTYSPPPCPPWYRQVLQILTYFLKGCNS